MFFIKETLQVFLMFFVFSGICHAQFLDSFDKKEIEGWFLLTGDGAVTMDFVQKSGYARIAVDATKDKYNVWWTVIKRDVSAYLDLRKLKDPNYELRVEARVRVGNAPRRVNFMINTQRTTNFHEHLKEFDIADTSRWHTISMTTRNFDAGPGDTVYVQLGVTDWGPGEYHVDIDYYRADIVDVNRVGSDKGEPLPYHPPIPDPETFSSHLGVAHDAMVSPDFPDVNFNDWHTGDGSADARILTVDADQWVILRWDFERFKDMRTAGAGVLELTTQSVAKGGNYIAAYDEDLGIEFDKIRVIEIFGGDPEWDQTKVTYNNFTQGRDYSEIFNSQMIYDVEVSNERKGKSFITISRPVMQRLLEGTTKGLLLRPLGVLNASFYASEEQSGHYGPKLHFNIAQQGEP